MRQPDSRVEPDDLDLVAMSRAALNYLRRNTDPAPDCGFEFALGPPGIPSHCSESLPPNKYAHEPVSVADTYCRMEMKQRHIREMAGEDAPDSFELGVRRRAEGDLPRVAEIAQRGVHFVRFEWHNHRGHFRMPCT